jgi:hypothetical protein
MPRDHVSWEDAMKFTVEMKFNCKHGHSNWVKLSPMEVFKTKAGAVRDAKQLREANPQYLFRVVKLVKL